METNELDQTTEQTPENSGTPTPEERLSQLEQNQVLTRILSDPDIRAVIEAKRQGKPVKVATDEKPEPEPEPEPSIVADLPEDDPVRQTLERVEKLVATKLERQLGPVVQRLEGVEGLANEVQKRELREQINATKQKYPDFEQYKAKMLEISQTQPNLPVEELYVLAKLRSGKLDLTNKATFSEKPTNQPRERETRKRETDQPRPRGRKGFNELLGEALRDLQISELGKE